MNNYITYAVQVFKIESKALLGLSEKLNEDYINSIESIKSANGKVIICGMGKSGIIGKKIAATLASTGTPSFFMHPGEAYHGDLGMVTPDDVFIAISNSGETDEVVKLIPFLKDNGNYLISMTGNPESTLAKASDAHLDVGVEEEACPLQLAPTASTTATLAMGDALAVTLMKARNFKPENFARFHPGGSLGRRLLSRVEDEMVCENLPFVSTTDSVMNAIHAISSGGLGLAIVTDVDGFAVVTDGDFRRVVEEFQDEVFAKTVADFMSVGPVCVSKGTRVEDALELMQKQGITSLLVKHNDEIIGVFKK
ncbi:KpsF/GutQ family sugar-phosphate isomerase [Neptunomonas phycophila]|uniref:KpsF/GutQ family sugar-phosphate isomerase n=1 Tax=Neptunomonas phycophila TaxID=1572645 RepID=UPI0026E30BB3|nr:KpsF/GutQ family sugar-phosphate isomerase [Neptunomonas phycophila]MDO6467096.1 KpsF/GutQ family sugar-phosphate isomerase [Neptunomonas phycophila]